MMNGSSPHLANNYFSRFVRCNTSLGCDAKGLVAKGVFSMPD